MSTSAFVTSAPDTLWPGLFTPWPSHIAFPEAIVLTAVQLQVAFTKGIFVISQMCVFCQVIKCLYGSKLMFQSIVSTDCSAFFATFLDVQGSSGPHQEQWLQQKQREHPHWWVIVFCKQTNLDLTDGLVVSVRKPLKVLTSLLQFI